MKYYTSPLLFAGLLLLLLGVPHAANAQTDIRGVSMLSTAGGGPAYVRDTDALFFNPANLWLDERGSRFVMTLGSVQAFGGGSLVQFSHYNDSFTQGNDLSKADMQSILNDWMGPLDSGKIRKLGVSAEIVPIAMAFRGYGWGAGLGVRTRTYTQLGFSRGLFDLLLVGTDQDGSFPVNMDIRSVAMTEISAGFSKLFPKQRLAIGIAPKMVLGLNYARTSMDSYVELSDGSITHNFDYDIQLAGNFNQDIGDAVNFFESSGFLTDATPSDFSDPFSAIAGRGFGLDLGATHEISKNLLVSASLTDLGYVNWTKNADAVSPTGSTFQFDGLDLDLDQVNNEYDGDFGAYVEDYFSTLVEDAYDEVERTQGAFKTKLPTAFHAGGSWHALKGLFVVNAGTSVALNQAAGNLSRKPSFHLGTEFHPGRRYSFPIRTGIRFGGDGALTAAFGFGIQTPVYDLSIGVAATPKTSLLGGGGRYMVGLSLVNFRI
ncbi:MAG: DUF5723 family protein [Rhodothermales bacterium]